MKELNTRRRKFLTAVGATGIAAVAAIGVGTRGSLAFTGSGDIYDGSGFTLTADWRETYNGTKIADSTVEPTPDGAAISLGNVMPGDTGTVSFRFGIDPDEDGGDVSATIDLALELLATAENGRNEPERSAGDTTPNQGELQEFLNVELWIDEGVGGIDEFGAENAIWDSGEQRLARGSFTGVAGETVTLPQGGDCLGTDETITVTFGWEFPDDAANDNRTQSDSVTFVFNATAVQCGGGSQ